MSANSYKEADSLKPTKRVKRTPHTDWMYDIMFDTQSIHTPIREKNTVIAPTNRLVSNVLVAGVPHPHDTFSAFSVPYS